MIRLHENRRTLFKLLRLGRGEKLQVTTGINVRIHDVHWTPDGTRVCEANHGDRECRFCANPQIPPPRTTIYLAVWPDLDPQPHLLILSQLAVPWAKTDIELQRIVMHVERGQRTQRIRTTLLHGAKRDTPEQPIDAWLRTLWQQL